MGAFSLPVGNYGWSSRLITSGAPLAAAGLFAGLWMCMDVANEPKLSGNECLS